MDAVLSVVNHSANEHNFNKSHHFKNSVSFGRSSKNDWSLPDPANFISNVHGNIRLSQGKFYLVDVSTNGILVNNNSKPIPKHTAFLLSSGDFITIGHYQIQFTVKNHSKTSQYLTQVKEHKSPSALSAATESLNRVVRGDEMDDVFSFPSIWGTEEPALRGNTVSEKPEVLKSTPSQPQDNDNKKNLISLLSGMNLEPETIAKIHNEEAWKLIGNIVKTTLVEASKFIQFQSQINLLSNQTKHKEESGTSLFTPEININQIVLNLLQEKQSPALTEAAAIDAAFKQIKLHYDSTLFALANEIDELDKYITPDQIAKTQKKPWQRKVRHQANCWQEYCARYQKHFALNGEILKHRINLVLSEK